MVRRAAGARWVIALLWLGLCSAGVAAQELPAPDPSVNASKVSPQAKGVQFVPFSTLPDAAKKKVREFRSRHDAAQKRKVEETFQKDPHIKAALERHGYTPEQIVAVSLAKDGSLILVVEEQGG